MARTTARMSLEDMRDAITEIPTIPETLARILDLLEDPNSGARDLADVIRADAPLASKILRLANSPLYQKNRVLTTIQECVAVLGYQTVRQVALCVAVISGLGRQCEEAGANLDYRDLWRHSVAVAAVAGAMAKARGGVDAERAFLAGLLHDLGKFALIICQPRSYDDAILERRRSGKPLVVVEQAALGFDHADAGRVLAAAWNFPEELLDVIANHHRGEAGDPTTAVVIAADYVANVLRSDASDMGFAADLVDASAVLQAAGLPPELDDEARERYRSAIDDASALANID